METRYPKSLVQAIKHLISNPDAEIAIPFAGETFRRRVVFNGFHYHSLWFKGQDGFLYQYPLTAHGLLEAGLRFEPEHIVYTRGQFCVEILYARRP